MTPLTTVSARYMPSQPRLWRAEEKVSEPLVELVQHKAASECRFDRLAGRGVDTVDEQCTFEQNRTDSLGSLAILFGEVQDDVGADIEALHFASFHYDSCCDYSYLYRFEAWVR